MSCRYILKSGASKGLACQKANTPGKEFCKRHAPKEIPKVPNTLPDTIEMLNFKLLTLDTTIENKMIISRRFRYLEMLPVTSTEYHKNLNWLRYALNFPYNSYVKSPVTDKDSIEDISTYISSVYQKLDSYIYGMTTVKEELMTFVCKRISNSSSNNHCLALHGKNGVGKTRFAHGLAHALDLPIRTINLGCVSDASISHFTGHSFTYVDSEPGRLVQILYETKCKNCIIYFDELDKIHQNGKGKSIFAFLTHLIDPSQNKKYQDVYLSGLELDLSQVFFVFSFNDLNAIDATVRDRLKVIQIPEHTIDDQIAIVNKFIIPEIENNLKFYLEPKLDQEIVKKIVMQQREHGLRTISRKLDSVYGKLNVARMLDSELQNRLSYFDTTRNQMIENILKSDAPQQKFMSFYS